MSTAFDAAGIRFKPLTPARWDDLVDLFGLERGANSGCWCLTPRMPQKDWKAMAREERREAFRTIVAKGPPPGLLAYHGKLAVGWCAVGPRSSVARFHAAKASAPVDPNIDTGKAFAITCFYIRTGYRKGGLMGLLADAAISFARKSGAASLEVCAIETDRPLIWGEGYVGLASVMRKVGFTEIARRSPTRPLMRIVLA